MARAEPVRVTCPSCGHSHAFATEGGPATLPHHCPRCGTDLVADGLLVPSEPEGPAAPAAPSALDEPSTEPLAAWFPTPLGWEAVPAALLAAFLAWSSLSRGFVAAAVAGADLVFHEAGHLIFAIFGLRFLTILAGTLGQLAFPVAAAVLFAARRRAAPFAVAAVWLGFNLVEIGRYAADAQARVLPLLAPDVDSHDWWNLLGMLGLREHCRGIGGTIQATGWLLWIAAPVWAVWRWARERWQPSRRSA
jgi:hypothetical protein